MRAFFRFAANVGAIFVNNSRQTFNKTRYQSWLKYQRQLLLTSGGGTMIAWTMFSKSDDKKSETDQKPLYRPILPPEIAQADKDYRMYALDAAYRCLAKFENTSSDPEILWRLARVIHDLGKNEFDAERKKEKLYKAFNLIEKALANESPEGNWAVHKWYAIIINSVGEVEGTKSHIQKANIMKEHLEKALELNPTDATTWHVLGVWHFSAADLPGWKRQIAKAIFGTPPSSTYEEALALFEKAENLDPGFYKANLYYMGETLERLGRKEEAKQALMKAAALPLYSKDDADIHEKVLNKLMLTYKMKQDDLTPEKLEGRRK